MSLGLSNLVPRPIPQALGWPFRRPAERLGCRRWHCCWLGRQCFGRLGEWWGGGAFYALDWHPCKSCSVMGVESKILPSGHAEKPERIPRRIRWEGFSVRRPFIDRSRLRTESVSPNTQKKK